jgi:peptide/nickel transport system substrate-binding protein
MLFSSLRRRTRLGLAATGVAAVAALALSGCSASSSASASSSITIFNGATGTIAENWNPFSPSQLQPTLGVIYEPLYYYNLASTSKPKPELATGFSWNSAGTQLTITTRKGVKWSDGTAFSAKDVAYTFNLIHDNPALNTSGLNATAKATSADTAVLTFPTKSFTQEPQVLGNQAIIPQHIWSKVKNPTTTINAKPVGTGPYTLKTFNSESYVLQKNTHYWEPGKPKIDTVRYISLSNADAASAALLSGKVDWMSAFLPNLKQLVGNHKDIAYVNTPALTTSLFTCSNAALGCTGPQTDPAVRQAIYQAIDRTQLNKLAGGGFAVPASPTLLLPSRDKSWIANSADVTIPQTGQASKAEQTLQSAGYTKGSNGIYEKDGKPISLTVQVVAGYSDYIAAIQVMQTELKKVGIELKSTQLSYNEWNSNETKGDFQLTMDSIGLGASANPYYTYNPRYSTGSTVKVGQAAASGGNYSRYSNPVVDAALKKAAATNDVSTQKAQYAIVQKQIVKDLPYIPIYVNSTLTEFNTTRAKGWPTNSDKYAFPASWKSWDNGIVLKNLTPSK